MIMEIVKYPDERLKKISSPVEEITEDIKILASNMLETMYANKGVGLAAPQVGVLSRIIVLDPTGGIEEKKPRVIINPELELIGNTKVNTGEGCLSVPLDYRADVKRHEKVYLRGLDIDGNKIDEEVDGIAAIILQHETDHLNGVLFIDKISHLRRSMYVNKVRKWLKSKNPE